MSGFSVFFSRVAQTNNKAHRLCAYFIIPLTSCRFCAIMHSSTVRTNKIKEGTCIPAISCRCQGESPGERAAHSVLCSLPLVPREDSPLARKSTVRARRHRLMASSMFTRRQNWSPLQDRALPGADPATADCWYCRRCASASLGRDCERLCTSTPKGTLCATRSGLKSPGQEKHPGKEPGQQRFPKHEESRLRSAQGETHPVFVRPTLCRCVRG